MNKVKVVIVDDHVLVQAGLKQLLELSDDIEVIAVANSGSECMRLLEKYSPDIVFMDIKMRGITGVEATRLITDKYPNVKVVILTIYDDSEYVTEAIQAGARGYVLKDVTRDQLLNVIRCIMADKAFLDPAVTSSIMNSVKGGKAISIPAHAPQLTQRELEIIEEVYTGQMDDEIANTLSISKHTVRSHIKNIYRKLGVSSKSQLITKAIQRRIIN